jgi:hypothetical protein
MTKDDGLCSSTSGRFLSKDNGSQNAVSALVAIKITLAAAHVQSRS